MSHPLAEDLEHILEHTKGLWDELRGQRLFITGGTGFLGCWLLESFAWASDRLRLGATAVVLTRHPDLFLKKAPHLATHPAIQLYTGDVRSFEFPPGNFSHIIHMAAETSQKLNVEKPLLVLDTIVEGTRRFLDFARRCGARKFLLSSSGAIYGKQPSDLTHVPEDYPGAPDVMDSGSCYGEGKRLAEYLCLLYNRHYGIETKIARGFAFVGPHLPLDTHFAIGNFIGDAIRGRPVQVRGDGTPYRSYLYAADAVIWLWTILCRGQACRPYNMGSEEDLTIAELARRVAETVQSTAEVRIADRPIPGKLPERYVPSTRRARTELGLQQYIDLPEAIRRTISWYKEFFTRE